MDLLLHRPGQRVTVRRHARGLLYIREEEPRQGSSAHMTALLRRPHLLPQALGGGAVTLPLQETERRMLHRREDLPRLRLPPLNRDEQARLDTLMDQVFGPRSTVCAVRAVK